MPQSIAYNVDRVPENRELKEVKENCRINRANRNRTGTNLPETKKELKRRIKGGQ